MHGIMEALSFLFGRKAKGGQLSASEVAAADESREL
jgi:hypothetical protein